MAIERKDRIVRYDILEYFKRAQDALNRRLYALKRELQALADKYSRLDTVETGAEVNVINGVKVKNEDITTVDGKVVTIDLGDYTKNEITEAIKAKLDGIHEFASEVVVNPQREDGVTLAHISVNGEDKFIKRGAIEYGELEHIPATFPPSEHNHDERYYGKAETESKLDLKSDITHLHDDRYYTESEIDSKVNTINSSIGTKADTSHTHDDRYYTESEIDSKLSTKSPLIGSTSLSKLSSNVTFGTGGEFSITQNNGSWWQRLRTTDESDKTHKRLIYEESQGTSGSSYTELFSVDGNGNAYAGGKLLSKNGHTHDDRYYTESEINTKLSGKSDVGHTHSNYAVQGSPNNLIDAGNEFTFVPSGYNGSIFFNYKTAGGKNGNIKEYIFGNGKGGSLGTAIHSGNIGSQSVKYATSSGNAATATKATQDSAGQQINTTYIKGLSISGNTITYTKGNGGTGSITVPTGAGAKGYITESKYNTDGSWYRKWSDGWLEQGGFCNATSNGVEITVNLLKPMKNTNYTVLKSFNTTLTYGYNAVFNVLYVQAYAKTTTSFKTWDGNTTLNTVWYACGQSA